MRRIFFYLLLKLFRLPKSTIPTDKKGLIIILVDGLGYRIFEEAIKKKYCSFFSKLTCQDYQILEYYCPPPAATTASESELFFGTHYNIPGFTWFDRTLFRFVRGNRGTEIGLFESTIKKEEDLLQKGSCILSVFSADANQCDLSGKVLNLKQPFKIISKLHYLFFLFLNPIRFLFTWYMIGKSLILGIIILIRQKSKKRFIAIMKNSFSQIFLGNISTYLAELEILRETPILFIDYVLYDEFAHEYGIENKNTLSSLRLISWYCASLYKATKKTERKYDFIILSDHGQTAAKPCGRYLNGGLEQMFSLALNDQSKKIIKTFGGPSLTIQRENYVYLIPAGSTLQVYFSERFMNPYLFDEVNNAYPSLITTLLKEKEIGWILIRKNQEKQLFIGKHGIVEFSKGKIVRMINKPFFNLDIDKRIIVSLAEYATYHNNGDLVIFADVNHEGKLYAFENHKGTHGGFYGEMTKPFIMTNLALVKQQLSKNNDMEKVYQKVRSTYLER